jgi:DNA-binding LacI/PurR family transcriptional regulator
MAIGKSRVTSQQVATKAGVSRTTVSFVLNNVPDSNIPESTRNKVRLAASELGYIPNAAAKMLVSGKTQTIGLVIAHAQHLAVDAFIPQLLHTLSQHSKEAGYNLLLETVDDVSAPDAYWKLVRGHQIDGLLVINARSDDSQLPDLIRKKFPVVILGFPKWKTKGLEVHSVATDAVGSAYTATNHLINLGYLKIAHIPFSPKEFFATQERLQGYTLALKEAGLPFQKDLVEHANYSAESGFFAMQQLLKKKPDAVFAGNDTIAIGALAAIQTAGLRIPEDIAVIGYDDIPTAAYLSPALTTIHVSAVEHGQKTIAMLEKLMRGEQIDDKNIVCKTELIIRDSCGAKTRAIL